MTGLRTLAAAAITLLALGACLNKPQPVKERFVLAASRDAASLPAVSGTPAGTGSGHGAMRILRVRVSPLFERRGFVYRRGEAEFETDFFREFFEPPASMLMLALGAWLDEAPVFTRVLRPHETARADWLLEGSADELYVDLRGEPASVLKMSFNLIDARSVQLDTSFRKSYEVRTPLADPSGAGMVEAWNESLSEILSRLEADLAAEFAS